MMEAGARGREVPTLGLFLADVTSLCLVLTLITNVINLLHIRGFSFALVKCECCGVRLCCSQGSTPAGSLHSAPPPLSCIPLLLLLLWRL